MKLDEIIDLSNSKFIVFTWNLEERTFNLVGDYAKKEDVAKITRIMPNDNNHPLWVVRKRKFYDPHAIYC